MHLPTTSPDHFVIRGGGDDFAMRQRRMFDKLSQAEKEFNKEENTSSLSQTGIDAISDPDLYLRNSRAIIKRNHYRTMQYRGKESIFKRPEGPAPSGTRKSIADHHRNPHKWTKYSLENIQNDQMSDKSNAQAAFSFLRELKARKAVERSKSEREDKAVPMELENSLVASSRCKLPSQILYRKTSESVPTKEPAVVVVTSDDKPVFRRSTIVMPEYVVGQKQEKKLKKAKPAVKIDRSRQLKLDHLEEIDE